MTDQDPTKRPPRPAPLKIGREESQAEWRRYIAACAQADEALRRKYPQERNVLNKRLN